MKFSYRLFVGLLLLAILGMSLWGLEPRRRVERENKSVAILADFRDIRTLARSADATVSEALALLKGKGLGGLMVSELTGEDVLNGLGLVRMAPTRDAGLAAPGMETVMFLPEGSSFPSLPSLVAMRVEGAPASGESGVLLSPVPLGALGVTGVVPDFEGLEAGTDAGLPLFYRVAPALSWQTRSALAVFQKVLELYPAISLVAPSGEVAVGYPDMAPLASLCGKRGLPIAQVEFSRQLGASQLESLALFNLLPLHSVTNEELLARRIGRQALKERLMRAADERSVRLLMLRPAPYGNVASGLEDYAKEVEGLADELRAGGFTISWPKPLFLSAAGMEGRSRLPAALACAAMFGLAFWRYCRRMGGRGLAAGFVLCSLALGLAAWKVPAAARLLGAVSAVFISTEAALTAMDSGDGRRIWKTLPMGFLFAVIGGLSLAAFFSDPFYMLRLKTFSGVKLSLLLPPLLVFLHDLRNRVHPESLRGLLSRPPLWGELLLGALLMLGLGIALFRSDNVQFIPGFEAKLRDFLEGVLVARPRSKEIFIGYPSLFLLSLALRAGLWTRYREVLRIGVVLGFSSVVNSFCHFHTPLDFILLREFNGLWVGTSFGILVFAAVRWLILPLWRRARFLAE